MTREELQEKLRELEERKLSAMRLHETKLTEIVEHHADTVEKLKQMKHEMLEKISSVRRVSLATMREAQRDECVRYKTINMRLDNERQQLFADYKAQGEEKQENS